MKKKAISLILAFAMLISLLIVPGAAVSPAPSASSNNEAEHYFYDQLTDGAKKIYDAMWDMYNSGVMEDGKSSYDLTANGAVTAQQVDAYLNNDRTLFNDFAAAKDAFDLEHPEVWYLDSTYLCLRTASTNGENHAILGPGISEDYYVQGVTGKEDVQQKTQALNQAVNIIVTGAQTQDFSELSESDKIVKQIKYVHDQVTKSISYRFETDCADGNQGYIRTVYALVTHEGVCESYSRSIQLILNKLHIPCVLVHGVQNSGTPEMHMWNLVKVQGSWYAIDATWDDPVKYDKATGKLAPHSNGLDGRENQTYFMVGAETIGQDWLPSGIVSTSGVEFKYPELSLNQYAGENVHDDGTGLHVSYTSMSEMEGAPAGQYKVDFNGKGLDKAAKEDGLYLLVRMYDEHQDGTEHSMADWYYGYAALYLLGHDNADDFLYDSDTGFYMCTATCEYIEFAMTTRPPDNFEKYDSYEDWGDNELFDSSGEPGFYHGDESDIFAKTDRLYNAESKYEAAPYVLTQTPACNSAHLAGYDYHVEVRWDDVLWHPSSADDRGPLVDTEMVEYIIDPDAEAVEDIEELEPIASHADDRAAAASTDRVKVQCITYQLDKNDRVVQSTLSVTPEWDADYDHIVDRVEYHMLPDLCPHKGEPGHQCSVEQGCPFDGVDFDFRPSDQWADDSTMYQFTVLGAVGSRSFRVPNSFDLNVVCFSLCPGCYRSQGIDWNLWGMPTLLDNPDDLDLDQVVMQGVDGHTETLKELQDRMKVDDLNGRITLVVEPIGEGQGSREKYNEVTGALEEFQGETGLDPDAILESSMYEITFTKLCQMIMLETGQSLRMQVGFPPGFDADSPVVFKAYHFTRDDEGNIISVQEIPVAVTPYGLVILCDSFSPFELVAVDETMTEEVNKTVVVSSGEGGSITHIDGTDTAGANGMIALEEGESAELVVKANEGYEIESVSFDGHEIPVSPVDNSVLIEYSDIENQSGILNASFIASTVRQEDEQKGFTPVIPDKAVSGSSAKPEHFSKTVIVGSDQNANFKTIQEAIDSIHSGSDQTGYTIQVEPGSYDAFTVPAGMDNLVITGSGDHTTTIKAGGIVVHSDNLTLDNLKFIAYGDCISVEGGDGLVVEECAFTGSGNGTAIALDDATTTFTIKDSSVSGYEIGVSQKNAIANTSHIKIDGNEFSDCEEAVDIVTSCTTGTVTVTGNTVRGTSARPAEITIVNISGNGAKAQVSDNKFENTVVAVAGFDADLEQSNDFDDDSLFAEAESSNGAFNVTFDTPDTHAGRWVLSDSATAPDITWPEDGPDFLSYVRGLLEQANAGSGSIVVEGIPKDDIAEVSRWMKENITYVANGSSNSGGGHHSSGGSSGGSTSTRYGVTVKNAEHGTVKADRTTASSGQKVTITATPDEGYVIDSVIVTTANGDKVTLTDNSDGTFTFTMPSGTVTVEAVFSEQSSGGAIFPFVDVAPGAWYARAVEYMFENGYIAGTSDTTFSPEMTTTRAQLVAILYHIAGTPAYTGTASFRDVAPGDWYYDAVSWAAENGIVAGFEDNTFRPDATVTREQIAAILYANSATEETDPDAGLTIDLTAFNDYAAISGWAIPAVQWACNIGLIGGTDTGNLNPTHGATRAEVAQILMNYTMR